jgi:hypothetical protein
MRAWFFAIFRSREKIGEVSDFPADFPSGVGFCVRSGF